MITGAVLATMLSVISRNALLAFSLVGCSNSSPVITNDAAPDATPDAGTGAFVLEPGAVAEVALQDGVGGERLATPSGTERFVVILGSMQLNGAKTAVKYSIDATNAQNVG